jgi:hypothetical protein
MLALSSVHTDTAILAWIPPRGTYPVADRFAAGRAGC